MKKESDKFVVVADIKNAFDDWPFDIGDTIIIRSNIIDMNAMGYGGVCVLQVVNFDSCFYEGTYLYPVKYLENIRILELESIKWYSYSLKIIKRQLKDIFDGMQK